MLDQNKAKYSSILGVYVDRLVTDEFSTFRRQSRGGRQCVANMQIAMVCIICGKCKEDNINVVKSMLINR